MGVSFQVIGAITWAILFLCFLTQRVRHKSLSQQNYLLQWQHWFIVGQLSIECMQRKFILTKAEIKMNLQHIRLVNLHNLNNGE